MNLTKKQHPANKGQKAMLDLGPYANFIIAAYSISALTLIALTLWVHWQEAHHKKMLSLFSDENEK